jgi:hypothetical protein
VGLAVAHPALTWPKRNTARNSCRVCVDRFMEEVFGMEVVNLVLSKRKLLKLRNYSTAIKSKLPVAYANNMSSELEST